MSWEPDPGFWRYRKVVVTGGTGFLGSHLVAALCDVGADVVVVVRDDVPVGPIHERWWSKVTRVRGDVTDQELMERVLVDVYADAAYAVITRPSRERTGEALLCEDVLVEAGITDLSVYAHAGADADLALDLFVDAVDPPGLPIAD